MIPATVTERQEASSLQRAGCIASVEITPSVAPGNGAGGEVGGVRKTLAPALNKFHVGNGEDGKHYWLTPPDLYAELDAEFHFDFDPCPYPKPEDFDGLTCEWGKSTYANIPFGSIVHEGKKKGPTAWVRKAIAENQKGKRVVLVYPVDKWLLMMLAAGAEVRNLGDVKWCATEDGSAGKGTGRHIAAFILGGKPSRDPDAKKRAALQLVLQSARAWANGAGNTLEIRDACDLLDGKKQPMWNDAKKKKSLGGGGAELVGDENRGTKKGEAPNA